MRPPTVNLAVGVIYSNGLPEVGGRVISGDSNPPPPLISVLIPAYNYASGVLQIIVPVLTEGRVDVEVLVHDDSNDRQVELALQPLKQLHMGLQYVHNSPARGAISNWNGLLSSARGRYLLLVHHDDYPLSDNFAFELIAELERHAWPDALLLTCVTHNVVRDRVKLGVCNYLRQLVVRKCPAYLLRRNIIGPPAAIVVRRDLFEPFDTRLKWLVDVEAYYRFFAKAPRRIECSRLIMVSSTGMPGSITNSIQEDKSSIARSELSYIADKFSLDGSWGLLRGRTRGARLALSFEWLLWASVKAVSALCHFVSGPRISLAAVQRRRNRFEDSA